ncbi:MAG: DUF3078 domain-containing protein [Bacteroidales bacterium]|jgi:hypothetical protein|nr:DUF3078 domain-containing protein [Bacteroidales bacterium]
MKRGINLMMILLMVTPFFAFAQDPATTVDKSRNWKIANKASITITQSGFRNWADGSENSMSLGSFDNFTAYYSKNRYIFDSYINLAYGTMWQESVDEWRKTDDKIDIMANDIWKFKVDNPHWFYGVLFTLNSQFADGYKYPDNEPRQFVSTFFSPAYINLAPGVTYRIGERFSWVFSPANMQALIIANKDIANAGIYGNKVKGDASAGNDNLKGEQIKLGLGIFSEIRWAQPLTKGIDIDTKLRITNNYLDPRTKNRWNFDVNYMLLLNFAITKYLSANLRLELVYDDDVKTKAPKVAGGDPTPILQVKEILGIGFAWNISNE